MLFFVICLVIGVGAVLLAQKADIECANAHVQPPAPWAPRAARRQDDRSRASAPTLALLAE